MKRYERSLASSRPPACSGSPLWGRKGGAWAPFTKVRGKTGVGCALAVVLLLTAGCSWKNSSARLPAPSSTTLTASAAESSPAESAQEEPAVEPEGSEAAAPEAGDAENPDPVPDSDPDPDPPQAIWTPVSDRPRPAWNPPPQYDWDEIPAYITAQPVQEKYNTDDTAVEIRLQNTGDKYFLYNYVYQLERFTQEGWLELDFKPRPVVEGLPLFVRPGQNLTLRFSFYDLMQPPIPGWYRITLGNGLDISCTFVLEAGDSKNLKVQNAILHGDAVARRGDGHIAVIPRRRIYAADVQTIWIEYINTSSESVYFPADPQCFIIEKALDSGWTRIPYAEQEAFPEASISLEPHSETAIGIDLSRLDSQWLTAGDYHILVKASDMPEQEWITCRFSLSKHAAD